MRSQPVNPGQDATASQYNNLREDAKGAGNLLAHQQSTPGMTLYVQPGVCYIGTTRTIFNGGNSPTFTAPTTNPKIDILVINSAGVLSIIAGTEAVTPSPPTYPTDKLVLCEVYLRVGTTAIYDTDQGTNGYIYRDVRSFISRGLTTAIPTPIAEGGTGATTPTEAKTNLEVELEKFTYGETIAINDALYLKAADGKVYKTSASFNDERIHNFVGFAKEAGALNDVKKVQIGGKVSGFSGLTIGTDYYLSTTAGGITIFPPIDNMFFIGLAIETTEIILNPLGRYIIFPTDNLKQSNDAEKSTSSGTYTKLKEIKVDMNIVLSKIRISFYFYWFQPTGWTHSGYMRIYKNGSSLGTERTLTGDGGVGATFTEDLGSFSKNDLIQVYGKTSVGNPETYVRASNFRLYFDKLKVPLLNFTNQDP